jgi:hypothetical protein
MARHQTAAMMRKYKKAMITTTKLQISGKIIVTMMTVAKVPLHKQRYKDET